MTNVETTVLNSLSKLCLKLHINFTDTTSRTWFFQQIKVPSLLLDALSEIAQTSEAPAFRLSRKAARSKKLPTSHGVTCGYQIKIDARSLILSRQDFRYFHAIRTLTHDARARINVITLPGT